MRQNVLVTDGEQRAALAAVRSLGRAGFRVTVCSPSGRSLAGASRHAAVECPTPDPLQQPDAFRERVAALCREHRVDVLLPVTDASLLACLPLQDRLEGVRIPFPAGEAHRAISDKLEVTRRAAELGIAVPRQVVLASADERPDADALPPFPLVVKPARSVVESGRGRIGVTVSHADSPAALGKALRRYPPEAYPLLLQERIEGTGEGVFLLLWDGCLVAAFAHRRLREKPPTGGVSVYREAIPLDPDLRHRSAALLESFSWTGVAMVEYRRSGRDGRPYLMEVNGRFWGSLQLAIDAGVDFPRLLVELAMGGTPEPVLDYRAGVRSRWWLGDLDHVIIRLRHTFDPDALPPGSGGRLAAAARFLLPWQPGDRSEVLRLFDPHPAVRELGEWWKALRARRRDGGSEQDARSGPEEEALPAAEAAEGNGTEPVSEGRRKQTETDFEAGGRPSGPIGERDGPLPTSDVHRSKRGSGT